MSFSNPIIGGNDTLVRDAIQSEGFESGATGWRIERTGNAEFNDVTIRGELDVGTATQYVKVYNAPTPINGPAVVFNSDSSTFPDDGFIRAIAGGPGGAYGVLFLSSPEGTGQTAAQLTLTSGDGVNRRTAGVFGDLDVNGNFTVEPAAGNPVLEVSSTGATVTGAVSVSGDITLPQGKRVKRGPLAGLSLLAGWTNFGGGYQNATYVEMPDGTGQLFGVISAGTTTNGTIIANVGVSVRPSAAHVFTCTSNGGAAVQLALATNGNIVLQSPPAGLSWIAFGGGCRWPIAGF